jgi:hypothetical protein
VTDRQVTPRFKQARAPKTRGRKARDERPGMSAGYLAAIRKLPSCISGKSPCEAHHLKCAGGRGVGLRAEDKWALPLTHDEHINGVERIGSRNEFKWFQDRGINPLDLATALWAAWPDQEKMLSVLIAHRSGLA